VPVLLALAAASMIYVAVADLIPGLHKRTEIRATVQQVLLIAAGIGTIVLTRPHRRPLRRIDGCCFALVLLDTVYCAVQN